MNDIAIRVEGLGKQYRLGAEKERYSTFGDQIRKWVSLRRLLIRRTRDEKRPPFWALKDVSFEVKRGEVLGIIGRNGAGKSTLLKILSRITEPTEGAIDIHGRVGSLLEVGTGFHPELTGRENIYLNGAILGMRRAEVVRKFDEIVAFAEVEKFIDTPVKHYSSGMYTRLAFAVAAHLEPDILIVDEVLAVGDAQFQKKCLGKMGEVSKGGRTVLFVSHNMAVLQAICSRVVLLDRGNIACDGETHAVIRRYLERPRSKGDDWNPVVRNRGTAIRIDAVELIVGGVVADHVLAGSACRIRIHYSSLDPVRVGGQLAISLLFFREGHKLTNLWTDYFPDTTPIKICDRGTVDCEIRRWPFRGFPVRVDVYTHTPTGVEEWLEECLTFDSEDGDYYGTGRVTQPDQGLCFLEHRWHTNADE